MPGRALQSAAHWFMAVHSGRGDRGRGGEKIRDRGRGEKDGGSEGRGTTKEREGGTSDGGGEKGSEGEGEEDREGEKGRDGRGKDRLMKWSRTKVERGSKHKGTSSFMGTASHLP